MRTPWVLPTLPLPVVGAVRSAVLRRISLAGGGGFAASLAASSRAAVPVAPLHIGGTGVTKGGALLPPVTPLGIRATCELVF